MSIFLFQIFSLYRPINILGYGIGILVRNGRRLTKMFNFNSRTMHFVFKYHRIWDKFTYRPSRTRSGDTPFHRKTTIYFDSGKAGSLAVVKSHLQPKIIQQMEGSDWTAGGLIIGWTSSRVD